MGRKGRKRVTARHPSFPAVAVIDRRPMVGRSIADALVSDGYQARYCPLERAASLRSVCSGPVQRVGVVGLCPEAAAEAVEIVEALSDAGAVTVVLCDDGVEQVTLAEAVAAGAAGVVSTGDRLADLEEALEAIARGEDVMSLAERYELEDVRREHRRELKAAMDRLGALTRREAEVLGALAEGKRPQQIADESFVALCTVRSQIKSILTKLGVHSQIEAVAIVHRAEWPARAAL